MSGNSFNSLVDGLTLTLGKGQVGHYKGKGATYRSNMAELLRDIEKVAKLIREKGDNLMTGRSKQAAANLKRVEEYPKLLDGLIRLVPDEEMPKVEAIIAKVNGPKRGRTLVAAAVASGGPGRSVSRGRAAPNPFNMFNESAAAPASKAKAASPWNEHVKAYAAAHGVSYAKALQNARSTYVPTAAAAPAARGRSRSVSKPRGAGGPGNANKRGTRKAKATPPAPAPYNPFNDPALFGNVKPAAVNPFNQFNNVAAAAPKNKTKRTRAKGAWNVHVANVQKANPGMKRANVLKLAGQKWGITKNSPLSEFGTLNLNNSSAAALASKQQNYMSELGM